MAHIYRFLALFCLTIGAAQAQQRLQPLTVELRSQLQYPRVAMLASTSGSLVLDAGSNDITVQGNLVIVSAQSSAAELVISGMPDQLVSFHLPSQVRLMTRNGSQLFLTNLHHTGQSTVRLDGSGLATVRVGATLTLPPQATAGDYRGRLFATADYVFE